MTLGIAVSIRSQKVVRNNKVCSQYFSRNAALFLLLTMLSGGTYPSLIVVSSRLFGLDIFYTGLNRYELKKLTKIKLISTICIGMYYVYNVY